MKINRWKKKAKTHDTITVNLTRSDQSCLKLFRLHLLWIFTVNLPNHNLKINKWRLKSASDNEKKKLLLFFFFNEMKTIKGCEGQAFF